MRTTREITEWRKANHDSRLDLFGANLFGADLRGADLFGANLRDADLRDADLRDADLRDADLRGANLFGAKLSGANVEHVSRCLEASSGSGYTMILADHGDEGLIVHCGCHRFTLEQAREHWREGKDHEEQHLRDVLAALDYLLGLAKSRGWTVSRDGLERWKREARR